MSDHEHAITLRYPDRFFIGGNWVKPSSSSTFEVRSSSSEEVVATVAEAQAADMDFAIKAARDAFDHGPWPRMSHAERAGYIAAMAEAFLRRSEDFARIWTQESGILFKLSSGRIGSWLHGSYSYYAGLAETFPFVEQRRSSAGLSARLVREPVGVVGAIVPWNGPAGLMGYKTAPGLIAGCTYVVKSSPEAPCSAYLLAEICEEVGLPAGVINVVTADREVSERLVRSPAIDKITFTGSTAAGRRIASICGDRVARVTLELGGKSPALVLADYDIGTAAQRIASGVGYLTGQVCHSLTRVVVNRDRHDEMVDALSSVMAGMRIGDPFDPATDVGPLSTAKHRETVERYIAIGQREGARLAFGGRRPSHLPRGYYIEPTLFANVENKSTIAQEEIFGPVISVIPAAGEAEAIAIANDTVFGLNASVFTDDLDHAYAVARQLRAGTVGHNASRTDFSIAFGGFKQSGLGREGGTDGLMPFLETKTVVLDQPFEAVPAE